jgi:hypothetical protein
MIPLPLLEESVGAPVEHAPASTAGSKIVGGEALAVNHPGLHRGLHAQHKPGVPDTSDPRNQAVSA